LYVENAASVELSKLMPVISECGGRYGVKSAGGGRKKWGGELKLAGRDERDRYNDDRKHA
jgi:hypothetical protein